MRQASFDHLQQLITAMRSRGTPIGTNVVCAVARGILLKHGKLSVEVRDSKFLNKDGLEVSFIEWGSLNGERVPNQKPYHRMFQKSSDSI